MDSAGPQTLLTPDEVATIFRVPVSTIYAWARNGTLPSFKVGKHLRFRTTEIGQLVNG